MHSMTSCFKYIVLFVFLWTSSLKLCQCNDSGCDFNESYDEVVTVSQLEKVQITVYKWCLNIIPRCPDTKHEYRTTYKNITIPKTRTVRRCCKDQIQLYDTCVPKCSSYQCPNIQCVPGTVRCECQPGYTGHLCGQKCDVGFWGAGCKNACNEACAFCDHRTGCCKRVTRRAPVAAAGLTFCNSDSVVGRLSENAIIDNGTAAHKDSTESATRSPAMRVQSARTIAAPEATTAADTHTVTRRPATVIPAVNQSDDGGASAERAVSTASASASPSPSKRRTDTVGGFVGTLTKVDVTVYKYDELVKKLMWISAMTVVAIAMMFIIMFVVFFNCYGGMSKVDCDDRKQRSQRHANAKDVHEHTQNRSSVQSNRYSKTPSLHMPSTNDLPIHQEIFCPVFSAPHVTGGSTLYDSPQPLYEILF